MKEILNISGNGSYSDIKARIIDIAQRYLECLLSNSYSIVVNRRGDYYSISVIIRDSDECIIKAP